MDQQVWQVSGANNIENVHMTENKQLSVCFFPVFWSRWTLGWTTAANEPLTPTSAVFRLYGP